MSRAGEPSDSDVLLPLLYRELRVLARSMLAKVPPGNTLQPTALVHEAFLRLRPDHRLKWNGRGHFFGAASQAMRQILVDQARRKSARKHGGDLQRVEAGEADLAIDPPSSDMLALDEAIRILERNDPRCAKVVLLRHIAGLRIAEVAEVLEVSIRTVERDWTFARGFLAAHLAEVR